MFGDDTNALYRISDAFCADGFMGALNFSQYNNNDQNQTNKYVQKKRAQEEIEYTLLTCVEEAEQELAENHHIINNVTKNIINNKTSFSFYSMSSSSPLLLFRVKK